MTGRYSHRKPGRAGRLVASAAVLIVATWPTLASPPVATAAAVATPVTDAPPVPLTVPDPVTVSLTSVAPATAVPRTPVTITGTVSNAGSIPIAAPVARALIGQRTLSSRDAVSSWAESGDEQPAVEVARFTVGKTLAPGAVAKFTLTIPATAISHRESFAVLPLSVDLLGTTTTPAATNAQMVLGSQRTFLPTLSSEKRYEPLSIAWLVPLTLDPDPALHGMDSPDRTAAWVKAIGPGSRLDRLITGTDSTLVTWAVDPAVLGPPQTSATLDPPAAPSPAPVATATPAPDGVAQPDPVAQATSALASRLKAAAPRHTLWSLPYADPDVAALLPLSSGDRALTELVGRPSTLDAAVGPARTDIAWPVEGTLTTRRETQLRRAFSSQGLAAAVTSSSTLTSPSGPTGDASRKSSGGLALLAYDEGLSRTFTQTTSTDSGAAATQRFLADSMALLGERPGTPGRSVLVAAPRTFAGDPTVLGSFFATIALAPWLTPTTAEQLLAVSGGAVPEIPAVEPAAAATSPRASTTPSPTASPAAADPVKPGPSSLTAAGLRTVPRTLSAITGIASIRGDGEPFAVRWTDAQDQLLSVRWRGQPGGPAAIGVATQAAITAVTGGVHVAPSSVNFFADKGVLQVTVVNDLAFAVHDVRLTLTPEQPRLRIGQQPGPLRIGAKSRTNVRVEVTAVAAGLVPINAVLTTPNRTPLGQIAHVTVRVQPTNTWIYWLLAGLAGVTLVIGTYRSLRRGSTRLSRPAAQELEFDD